MKREELLLRKTWLGHWSGSVSRIEPAIGSSSGVPDTYLAEHGEGGWVEFKVVDESGAFELEPSQRKWLRDFLPHAKNVAICAMDREGFWIFHASWALSAGENAHLIGGAKTLWASLPASAFPFLLCSLAWGGSRG